MRIEPNTVTPQKVAVLRRRLEAAKRRNRRELDRLRTKPPGRNAGATLAAIDRRLARDRELVRRLAELEEE